MSALPPKADIPNEHPRPEAADVSFSSLAALARTAIVD
jgi:hypothetical protein